MCPSGRPLRNRSPDVAWARRVSGRRWRGRATGLGGSGECQCQGREGLTTPPRDLRRTGGGGAVGRRISRFLAFSSQFFRLLAILLVVSLPFFLSIYVFICSLLMALASFFSSSLFSVFFLFSSCLSSRFLDIFLSFYFSPLIFLSLLFPFSFFSLLTFSLLFSSLLFSPLLLLFLFPLLVFFKTKIMFVPLSLSRREGKCTS